MTSDMTKILLEKVIGISEDMATAINKIDNTNKTVEVIQTNIKVMADSIRGNHERWISDKEEIYTRLKPLEDDLKKRSAFTSEVKKKSWDTVWDWAKVGIVFLAGYLLTIIRK